MRNPECTCGPEDGRHDPGCPALDWDAWEDLLGPDSPMSNALSEWGSMDWVRHGGQDYRDHAARYRAIIAREVEKAYRVICKGESVDGTDHE